MAAVVTREVEKNQTRRKRFVDDQNAPLSHLRHGWKASVVALSLSALLLGKTAVIRLESYQNA